MRLGPSPDGSRPDPSWYSIVQARDGKLYTTATGASGRGVVLAWNTDGTFAHSIGRPGDGPGEISTQGSPYPFKQPSEAVTCSGARTFWVARAVEGAYLLEEWSPEGELLRTFRRTASWFDPQREDDPLSINMPPFQALHASPDGLVWVMAVVRDPRWRPHDESSGADPRLSELFDVRYEVIDPAAADVLASAPVDDIANDPGTLLPPLTRFIPRASRSYRPVADTATGLETIEIFDLVLTGRRPVQ
jgi:hypothetical protein